MSGRENVFHIESVNGLRHVGGGDGGLVVNALIERSTVSSSRKRVGRGQGRHGETFRQSTESGLPLQHHIGKMVDSVSEK